MALDYLHTPSPSITTISIHDETDMTRYWTKGQNLQEETSDESMDAVQNGGKRVCRNIHDLSRPSVVSIPTSLTRTSALTPSHRNQRNFRADPSGGFPLS